MALNDSQKRVLAAMRTDFIPYLALLNLIQRSADIGDEVGLMNETIRQLDNTITDLDKLVGGDGHILDGVGFDD